MIKQLTWSPGAEASGRVERPAVVTHTRQYAGCVDARVEEIGTAAPGHRRAAAARHLKAQTGTPPALLVLHGPVPAGDSSHCYTAQ